MNTIEIYLRPKRSKAQKVRLIGPSSWKELSTAQSVAMMRFRKLVGNDPATQFAVLKLLYKLKARHMQWLFDINFIRRQGIEPQDQLLLLEHGQNILQTIAWVGQDDPDASFPRQFRRSDYPANCTALNSWYKKHQFGAIYIGPQDALASCSFSEFMYADKAFRDGNLPLLAAILYRPKDKTGSPIPFDHSVSKQVAGLFEKLDPALLERIAFGYGNTLLRMGRIFKYVFKYQEPEEATANRNKKPGTWLDVVIGMAQFDATKINQIEDLNVYLVLKVLDSQVKQAEELEAKLEALKSKSHV